MRQSGEMLWPETVRQLGFGALVAALLIMLAACASAPSLKDNGSYEPQGRTVPPIVIQQVIGLPPNKLSELKTALAVAGGQRDIGIVEGQPPEGSFGLSGQFRTFVESAGVRVVYQWELRDGTGVLIQTIPGEDNAGLFTGADPWAAVTTSVIERIARSTAQQLASRLAQMGYATRLSKLTVPPSAYFAAAGPNAQREIDFETLNGQGMAEAGTDLIAAPQNPPMALAAAEPVPGEAEPGTAPPAPEAVAADAEDAAATAPAAKGGNQNGKVQIRAVAVLPVNGSPGGGDAELTAAMRKTLSKAGWPVVTKPQPDALTIAGHVEVRNQGATQQDVSVRWEVRMPDGKSLGDVKQANRVPAGALDHGWGDAAFAVSEAAAMGIFDIIKQVR